MNSSEAVLLIFQHKQLSLTNLFSKVVDGVPVYTDDCVYLLSEALRTDRGLKATLYIDDSSAAIVYYNPKTIRIEKTISLPLPPSSRSKISINRVRLAVSMFRRQMFKEPNRNGN